MFPEAPHLALQNVSAARHLFQKQLPVLQMYVLLVFRYSGKQSRTADRPYTVVLQEQPPELLIVLPSTRPGAHLRTHQNSLQMLAGPIDGQV
ncbi:hypothetical protein D3C76_1376210 [compost metagenome]